MDIFQSLPALLRVFLILAIVLALLQFKIPLGAALGVATAALALFFEITWPQWLRAVGRGLVSSETLFMVVLVVGTLTLSNAMNACGQIQRLIAHFRALVGESRMMLVAFPAMIGLLPMPGGAIFSAPMVEEASRATDLSPARRTIINYWFRHIWEFWFPLYPGVILAMALTRVEPWRFIVLALPMTLAALAAGYVCLLRNIRMAGRRELKLTAANLRRFLAEMAPVGIIIAALFILEPALGAAGLLPREAPLWIKRSPLILGLAASLAWVAWANGMDGRACLRLFAKKNVASIGLLVFSVMVFKQGLEAAGAVDQLKSDLLAYRIPLVAVTALLPLVAGIVVGIAVGFVGVSFPIVLPLLSSAGIHGGALAPYAFLAFTWGYAGMMLSPVHLCLLLTRDYFKSNLLGAYKYLVPLNLLILAAAAGLFWLYR